MTVYKLLKNQELQKDQTEFWNEKRMSKPHSY